MKKQTLVLLFVVVLLIVGYTCYSCKHTEHYAVDMLGLPRRKYHLWDEDYNWDDNSNYGV
jgi:hypothetical protein